MLIKKLSKILCIAVVLGTITLTTACQKQQASETKDTQVEVKQEIEASGVIKSSNTKVISFDVPATVENLKVKVGQRVKKDDVLAELSFNTKNIQVRTEKNQYEKTFFKNDNIVCDLDNAIVSQIAYQKGETIVPGKYAFELVDLSGLYVEVNVSEEFIKDVKEGAEVTIVPTYNTSKTLKGKVVRKSQVATTKNGETNVIVDISLDDKDENLLPNYNVEVKIKK
ncbi:MAG: efflux RND transporter periplasmic adaptor subunit [Clostridiaceae bacterium]